MIRISCMAVAMTASLSLAGTAFAGGSVQVDQEPVVYAPTVSVVDSNWTGGYLGLALSKHDAELSGFGSSVSDDDNGVGVFGGYNYDMGQYVIGGELSFDRAGEGDTDIDLTRLKGRIGYDAGRWMPYAMLGLAHVKADDGINSVSENGMTYGLGADFMVTDNFLMGAEISRSSFSDFVVDGVDLDIDTIQIRGAWKF